MRKEFDALQVANWFLAKNRADQALDEFVEPLSQMKIHKLLYYAQGVYLAYTDGEKLFKNDLLAWKHGPVVYDVYNKYRGKYEITEELLPEQIEDFKTIENDTSAGAILNVVYNHYGNMSAWDLRNQTHSERPWNEIFYSDKADKVIPTEIIEEFFKEEILVG